MLLFLGTRRFIPDLQTTPDFSTPRSRPSKGSTQVLFGVTPFALEQQPAEKETLNNGTIVASPTSITSHESRQPLNYPNVIL